MSCAALGHKPYSHNPRNRQGGEEEKEEGEEEKEEGEEEKERRGVKNKKEDEVHKDRNDDKVLPPDSGPSKAGMIKFIELANEASQRQPSRLHFASHYSNSRKAVEQTRVSMGAGIIPPLRNGGCPRSFRHHKSRRSSITDYSSFRHTLQERIKSHVPWHHNLRDSRRPASPFQFSHRHIS